MEDIRTLSNHSESPANHSESTSSSFAPPATLKEMFDPQIECMHAVRAEQARERGFALRSEIRSIGDTWFIDPCYGSGFYWYCTLDEGVAVASMKVRFFNDVNMGTNTMDFVCFGLYGKNMPAYFASAKTMRNEVLLGYNWKSEPFQTTVKASELLISTSLTFTPEAVSAYARQLGCRPIDIARAANLLKGGKDIVGLPAALRTMAAARPGLKYAKDYYRSKIREALILLLDGLERSDCGCMPNAVDEYAVGEGCSYIEEHLSSDLSTRKLSEVLHVSEGKLIKAFRAIEETTPQAYVRRRRISHAQLLLTNCAEVSVREIARCVGYKNQGSFTDAFRRETGCTPSEYRALKRKRT